MLYYDNTKQPEIMISLTDFTSPELTKAITEFEEGNGSIARISRFIENLLSALILAIASQEG